MRLGRHPRRTVAAMVTGLGLLAAACGAGGVGSADRGGEGVEASGSPDGGEQQVNALFSDQFPTIEQSTFDLASLQGEDAVLWFWAPW